MNNKSNLFLNEEDGVIRNFKELYSVCLPELSEGKTFYPRVPSNRAYNEDDKTPRICLSSSLGGCLSAVPWGGKGFDNMMLNSYDSLKSCVIKVLVFDVEDIEYENLLKPSFLYKNDYVRDAEISSEYWVINQELKATREHYIQVTDYFEEIYDNISYEDMKIIENDDTLDVEDYIDGCFSKIIVSDYIDIDYKDIAIGDIIEIPRSSFPVDFDSSTIEASIKDIVDDFLVLSNMMLAIDIDENYINIYLAQSATIVIKDFIRSIIENISVNN